jgi:septal ring factor EnvC (AmiA/AmiB activator)
MIGDLMNLEQYKQKLARAKGQKDLIEETLEKTVEELAEKEAAEAKRKADVKEAKALAAKALAEKEENERKQRAAVAEAALQAAKDRKAAEDAAKAKAEAAKAAAQADYSARIMSALTPDPDRMLALTAAAGLLIPVFEEKHRAHMTAKGRNPADYGSAYSMAVQDLRALAEQEKSDG